jgi:hypothetical protein
VTRYRSYRYYISALAFMFLVQRPCVAAVQGFTFLNLSTSARAAAMGDAQVAVSGDPAAIYWNPSLLAFAQGAEVSLTHVEWFQNFRLETAALAGRSSVINYGALVTGMYAGQEDLVRRDSTGADEGHFGFYDLAIEVCAAKEVRSGFAAGIGAKYVVESIDQISYSTIAAELGVIWNTSIPGLKLGGALSNVGPVSKSGGVDIELPLTGRVGLAYQRPVPAFDGEVTLAIDGDVRKDDQTHFHIGGEVLLKRALMLDVGWKSSYDSQSGSVGVGIVAGRARVHYAYVPSSTGLGTTHRFTLRYGF